MSCQTNGLKQQYFTIQKGDVCQIRFEQILDGLDTYMSMEAHCIFSAQYPMEASATPDFILCALNHRAV